MYIGAESRCRAALLLSGSRKQSFGTWLGQKGQFYRKLPATPAYLARLTATGLSQTVLSRHYQLVQATEAAKLYQKNLAADTKQRRRERNRSLAARDR